MHTDSSFFEVSLILALSTLLGTLGQKLRQPLLIMFLCAGVIAGPAVLGIIASYKQIELLAQIGISILLFIVGLKLDLHLIKTTGPVALATGLGQIIFTSLIGFFIALGLGMNTLTSAYVSVALTFSSTIIIIKLLSDKKEIDSLHGQIAVGFLIVQDIAAIFSLILLTTYAKNATFFSVQTLIMLIKGVFLFACVGILMKYFIPWFTKKITHSQELLTLFAISWAVLLAAISENLGFSKEVGAFLAGVSLASNMYRESINSHLTGIRDFMLLFFFIDLGAKLDLSIVGSQVDVSLIFSIFVLVGNPLIVMAIMGFMGYQRRTSFMAGLTVAQISEFSLILCSLGVSLGHIRKETMGLITLVGIITIFASTYMILYSGILYNFLALPLKIFERKNPYREASFDLVKHIKAVDVILVGLGNYGSGIAEHLLRRNKTVLGVDFDPVSLAKWNDRGISVLYGDVAHPELHSHLPLEKTRWVACTVRSRELNLSMLHNLKAKHYEGKIALTATSSKEAEEFEKAGADAILRPFNDASEQAADSLAYAMDFLQANVHWPFRFREIRIQSDTSVAGKKISEIGLDPDGEISIVAVNRWGKIHYELDDDYRLYPGDRLIVMAPTEKLRQAETILKEFQKNEIKNSPDSLIVTEIIIDKISDFFGKTLQEIDLVRKYNVSIVGIRREEDQEIIITNPKETETTKENDHLIIIGNYKSVEAIKKLQ